MAAKKILIIEDSEVQGVMLKKLLEKEGYEVSWGKNGEEGLAMIREKSPDLIISDIVMPVMDGYQLCKKLRDDEALKKIPLILLTQLTEPEEVIRGLESGADHYLTKPFDEEYLLKKVALLLKTPDRYRNNPAKRSIEFEYAGKPFEVHSSRVQTLSYLISTYENAILKNKGLIEAEEKLRALNETLEEKVKERTAALMLSETRYRVVTELASDAIICIDATGAIYLWNKKAEELFGYTAEEALGKGLHKLVVPEKHRGKAYKGLDLFFKTGEGPAVGKVFELTAMKKDGTEFPVELSISAMKVSGAWHSTGIVRDITERKEADKSLRESEAKYHMLIESLNEGIWMIDKDANTSFVNPQMAQMLGYSVEEMQGRHLFSFMDERGKEIATQKLERRKQGIREQHDFEFLHKDGGRIYVAMETGPVLDDAGNYAGAIAGVIEITERKKAEIFIKSILESIGEGFVVIDPEYRIISANRAYCEQNGKPLEDIINRHCYEISHHSDKPCYEAGASCASRHTFATGEPRIELHTHYDKKGTPVYVEVKSYPMEYREGRVVSVIEISNDITQHKKLEEQLRHAQKMEAVGVLAGGIAHDFNNILNVIIGYGIMVMDKLEAGSPLKGHMAEVLAAADRAATLTRRLLVYSRKHIVELKEININELILGVQKMLSRIIRENIHIDLDLADRRLVVQADAGQIEQVLMNLATNAKDAMPEGGRLTIGTGTQEITGEHIAAYGYGKQGIYAIITVADTGFGMDRETQQKIFQPFFTTKGIGEGTGLGLSISYEIIKQHKGFINVYSEPGHGTVFKIYLPLLEEPATLEQKTESPGAVKGGRETVLVAEDDASLRNLMVIVLESFGYHVIAAEDGEDAIAKFMENREGIALAMLDLIMPKKNGKEVSVAIREKSPRTKILFMSGYTDDIIKAQELKESDFEFIQKPVVPRDLLKKVRDILDSGKLPINEKGA